MPNDDSMANEELSRSAVARTLGVDLEAPASRHHRVARKALWAAAAIVLVLAGFVWSRADGSAAVQYQTLPAERGELRVTVTATGTLEPTNQVDVGSEVSGTIEKVLVEEDDRVKAGQVLARIDPAKLSAQVLQLEAGLQAAEARQRQAAATREESRTQLNRLEQLHEATKGTTPSLQDLDTQRAAAKRAEADEASAAATVSQAGASLQALRTDLAKAVIRSPIDGVVLTRNAEPGATVAAAFQAPILFKIAEDLRRMELRVDVDEADVAQVKDGEDATFTVDAYPGRAFAAQVQRVRQASQTTDGVVTYEAVLVVDNSTLALRPGMTATAELTVLRVQDAVLVPNAALRFTPPAAQIQASGDQRSFIRRLMPGPPPRRPAATPADTNGRTQRVWALKDGDVPVAVPIEAGATDGTRTQVVSGDVTPGLALVVDTVGKE